MKSGGLASGPAEATSGWSAGVAGPQVLILVVAALVLTNIPMSRWGSGGHPNYVWATVSTLGAMWAIWDHRRYAWIFLIAATAVTLILYPLSIAGVIHTGLPVWWILLTSAADIAALAILLSPPIRRWVAR